MTVKDTTAIKEAMNKAEAECYLDSGYPEPGNFDDLVKSVFELLDTLDEYFGWEKTEC